MKYILYNLFAYFWRQICLKAELYVTGRQRRWRLQCADRDFPESISPYQDDLSRYFWRYRRLTYCRRMWRTTFSGSFFFLKSTFFFFLLIWKIFSAPYIEKFFSSMYELKLVFRASSSVGSEGILFDDFSNLLFIFAKEKGISQYLMISDALLILHSLRIGSGQVKW